MRRRGVELEHLRCNGGRWRQAQQLQGVVHHVHGIAECGHAGNANAAGRWACGQPLGAAKPRGGRPALRAGLEDLERAAAADGREVGQLEASVCCAAQRKQLAGAAGLATAGGAS